MTEPLEAASAALIIAAIVGGVSFALGAPLWAFWAVTAITFLGESRR